MGKSKGRGATGVVSSGRRERVAGGTSREVRRGQIRQGLEAKAFGSYPKGSWQL